MSLASLRPARTLRRLGRGARGLVPLTPPPYVIVDADAAAFVARFAVEPNDTYKAAIDTFVQRLKNGAVHGTNTFAKSFAFWPPAPDEQSAKLNLMSTDFTLTKIGAPIFTPYRGWTFNGVNTLLDTGFNPTTHGGAGWLNSAAIGLFSMTSGQGPDASSRCDMGADTSCQMVCRTTSDTVQVLLNRPALMTSNTGVTDGSGHFCGSRAAVGDMKAYRNGVQIGLSLAATTTKSNSNIGIGANSVSAPTVYSSRQIASAHICSGLTANEVGDISAAYAELMTAVGVA
jgi:hypothetical protein